MSLDLFRIRTYALGAGVGMLYLAGFTGTFFILTQYLQTGQRIGSAAGIAVTGSGFYSQVAATPGDFAGAFRDGLIVIAAFVAAALGLAVFDAATRSVARA